MPFPENYIKLRIKGSVVRERTRADGSSVAKHYGCKRAKHCGMERDWGEKTLKIELLRYAELSRVICKTLSDRLRVGTNRFHGNLWHWVSQQVGSWSSGKLTFTKDVTNAEASTGSGALQGRRLRVVTVEVSAMKGGVRCEVKELVGTSWTGSAKKKKLKFELQSWPKLCGILGH